MYDAWHNAFIEYTGQTLDYLLAGGKIVRYCDGFELHYGLIHPDAMIVDLVEQKPYGEPKAVPAMDDVIAEEELEVTDIDDVALDLELPWSISNDEDN